MCRQGMTLHTIFLPELLSLSLSLKPRTDTVHPVFTIKSTEQQPAQTTQQTSA